jgi:hypothetical protein
MLVLRVIGALLVVAEALSVVRGWLWRLHDRLWPWDDDGGPLLAGMGDGIQLAAELEELEDAAAESYR